MLGSLQPGQAVITLNDRIKRVGKINTDIAEWLQVGTHLPIALPQLLIYGKERRRVEEAYVSGLRKLARKQPPDEASELGVFSTPWQKIVSSTESLAQSHHILAQKIEVDVERPLREFTAKNREMQAISTMQGNLASLARDMEGAQKKSDKLKDKGAKAAGKVASATSEVENATSQWESQAPFVFEKLQAVDESRLNYLRDVLTQFQTHEVDQVERNRVTAEECLNALLNVETADEIVTFAAKVTGGRQKTERQKSRTSAGGALAPSTPSRSEPDAQPTPGRAELDAQSQRSGVSESPGKSASGNEQRPVGFGGLKRLGTVMRRRQSTAPYGRASSPEKRSTTKFRPFGGRESSSKDVQRLPSPAPNMPTPSLQSSSVQEERGTTNQRDSPPRVTGPQRPNELLNGDNRGTATIAQRTPSATDGPANEDAPHIQTPPSIAPLPVAEEVQKDAEGFTIPLSGSDAISKAEQEAAGENTQPQFKLDIREDPIQEEGADAETALAHVANKLRLQAAPTRRVGTTRGRRDVRNTIFVPSSQTPESVMNDPSAPPLPSPYKIGRTNALSSDDPPGSDTQSIRSSRSLNSLSSATIKHPEMHEPGLNTSIVETVSAWLEHGQVTKAIVIGELALAYNPGETMTTSGTESIRLENFQVLEKVAPNPTFIIQSSDRPAGEYGVNLGNISRTAVAFKYQLHLDESNLALHAPITFTPTWKIEPNQASIILNYNLNPSFAVGGKERIVLQNTIFIISLEGTKASTCQSKPTGTFLRDRSLVYWKLGELTLEASSQPQKLVARFTTEAEAKPGNIEARWEISGEHATGFGGGLHLTQMSTTSDGVVGSSESSDPFADERAAPSPSMTWKDVPTMRKLISGKYVAV
ncbi:MAG: hypothetical protein M1835_000338 [Candelina submexicana]|nr:MAG: hypothetical protein M1835_000338 [Candelina submexicana]